MTMQDKDQQIVDSIKSELNESVDNINARDLSAITQARYHALGRQQTSAKKTNKNFNWMYVPVGAIATVCLAVVVYSYIPVTQVSTDGQNLAQENQTRENQAQENQAQENQAQENQELVSTLGGFDFNEDPEISEELDFLEWLDAYESST